MASLHKENSASRRIFGKAGSLNNGRSDQAPGSAGTSPHKPSSPKCPECGSAKTWKDGLRQTNHGPVQRYICCSCGHRFSNPNNLKRATFNDSEVSKAPQRISSIILKRHEGITNQCQICAAQQKGAKNLAAAEIEKEKQAAGATQQTADIKGKIIEYIWALKKQGYAETTVLGYGYIIKWLTKKGADLFNPETVKEILAKETCSSSRKANIVKAYTLWLNMHGFTWNPPQYQPISKLPFIPLEKELDDLIAGCSRQMAAFLQLLKETAARCGEALKLRWTDVDFATNTVRITPEKGSSPRIVKISTTLAAMLGSLSKQQQKIFTYKNTFYLRKTFAKQRKRVAHKLGNPRIIQIHFHTFRHWKATMLYSQTKDILYVKNFLGHKNINNTLIYVQLADVIFKENDEYVCKAAKTLEEAAKLIEAGFEYVTDVDGVKLFRKRK